MNVNEINLNYDNLTWLGHKARASNLSSALRKDMIEYGFTLSESASWALSLAINWENQKDHLIIREDQDVDEDHVVQMVSLLVAEGYWSDATFLVCCTALPPEAGQAM